MDRLADSELAELVEGRVDPRRGVTPRLGYVKHLLTGTFLVVLVFGRCVMGSVLGPTVSASLLLLPPIGLIACWLIPIGIRLRTRRMYNELGGFICPWCRYGLHGLPDDGRCPECGNPYTRSVCEQLYTNVYRSYRPAPELLRESEHAAWSLMLELRRQSETDLDK